MPPFQKRSKGDAASGYDFFAITPSDSANFAFQVAGIYVGVGGDVVAVTQAGTAVTFKNAVAGSVLPICAIRVNAASTTATNLVGIY